MRTGVAYLGHHNPKHVQTDLNELKDLGCDDVLLAAQEIDFVYFPGKIEFLPQIAADLGMRPVAILWGLLNLFGGGRSSQFLLAHPECHQVNEDCSWNAAGCFNNSKNIAHVRQLIDRIAELGYRGYFIDEPQPLDCFCEACCKLFADWFHNDLRSAEAKTAAAFRRRCVVHYVKTIADYVKDNHPEVKTFCCIPPENRDCWAEAAGITTLDNLGTDLYWANDDRDAETMRPVIQEINALCRTRGKQNHQWLQCWGVQKGNENRIAELGKILVESKPDALYVWAFHGQIGTNEACEDAMAAWKTAADLLTIELR